MHHVHNNHVLKGMALVDLRPRQTARVNRKLDTDVLKRSFWHKPQPNDLRWEIYMFFTVMRPRILAAEATIFRRHDYFYIFPQSGRKLSEVGLLRSQVFIHTILSHVYDIEYVTNVKIRIRDVCYYPLRWRFVRVIIISGTHNFYRFTFCYKTMYCIILIFLKTVRDQQWWS